MYSYLLQLGAFKYAIKKSTYFDSVKYISRLYSLFLGLIKCYVCHFIYIIFNLCCTYLYTYLGVSVFILGVKYKYKLSFRL